MDSENRNKEKRPQGCCAWLLIIFSTFLIAILFPITIWFCVKTVQQYERAAIFRLGRLKSGKAVGPGLFWINCFTDAFTKVYICIKL
jgi:erythrocyte band 7 integral membrane protein